MPSRLNLQPGTIGSPLQVITNSFAITDLPSDIFYHYDAFPDFTEPPGRTACRRIIDALQIKFPEVFTPRAAYDGHKNMFRAQALSLPSGGGLFEVSRGNGPKSRCDKVRLTQVATVDARSIIDVVQGNTGHSSQSLTTLTLLNILVNMGPIMMYPSNARSFFTKNSRDILGNGLELWQGFYQSVRPSMGRMLVNVDVSSAVLYSGGSLLELIKAYLGIKNIRDLVPKSSEVMDKKLRRLIDFVKNLQVCSTTPSQTPPKWKRIKEVVMVGADDYQFEIETTGETLTISQYYLKTYNYRVQFGKIICIGIGRAVFPLEVLEVREGQLYRKTLPPSLSQRLLKFSTQKPAERTKLIENSRKLLGYDDSDFLRQSGMRIDNCLLRVEGRILSSPPIQWEKKSRPDVPKGGSWNLIGKVLQQPQPVKAWAIVLYDRNLNPGSGPVQKFLNTFVDTCTKLGMAFPDAQPPIIRGRTGANDKYIHEDMENAAGQAMQTFSSSRPTFIIIIMPPAAPEVRIAIKYWGDCIRGCATQCMNVEKLARANAQYCANLALKINVKIGGVNATLANESQVMKSLAKEPTMIIGADVSHASPGSCHPSVVGFVSSVDDKFARYVASTGVQTHVEIIQDLGTFIEKAVRSFYQYWHYQTKGQSILPSRIIFYRDGVSEGELAVVRSQEIKVIKDTFKKIWTEKNFKTPLPKLTFIIVGKRHHVRFFPKSPQDGDKSGNCPAGLVIDKGIVNPVDYDFFLQSHAGLLGTSRPSHYIVIEDDNALGADMLQGISFALCHVYARATRSVSIPAPVYYADIVASRGRIHSTLLREGGETSSSIKGDQSTLAEHKAHFQGVAEGLKNSMYFM